MISVATGALLIVGTFKKHLPDPDFKVRKFPFVTFIVFRKSTSHK